MLDVKWCIPAGQELIFLPEAGKAIEFCCPCVPGAVGDEREQILIVNLPGSANTYKWVIAPLILYLLERAWRLWKSQFRALQVRN